MFKVYLQNANTEQFGLRLEKTVFGVSHTLLYAEEFVSHDDALSRCEEIRRHGADPAAYELTTQDGRYGYQLKAGGHVLAQTPVVPTQQAADEILAAAIADIPSAQTEVSQS
ncbi:MAG: hypothetical protein AAFR65_16600 [Pseudomonadota bacterium]